MSVARLQVWQVMSHLGLSELWLRVGSPPCKRQAFARFTSSFYPKRIARILGGGLTSQTLKVLDTL